MLSLFGLTHKFIDMVKTIDFCTQEKHKYKDERSCFLRKVYQDNDMFLLCGLTVMQFVSTGMTSLVLVLQIINFFTQELHRYKEY